MKAYRERHREMINRAKLKPCTDCGIQYSTWIMQFDHRIGTIKKFTIGSNVCKGKQDLLDEMSKCDVICANCHAERTHQQHIKNPGNRKASFVLTKEECDQAVWVNPKPDGRGRHHNQWCSRKKKALVDE